MKTKAKLLIIPIIILATFLAPFKAIAASAQQLNLKMDSWFHDKDSYTMDADVNIYYSFYNKDNVVLNISDDKAWLTLSADEFTHGEKHFKTPEITFTGTYENKNGKNIIDLIGKTSGTIINEYLTRTNYNNTTVDKITLEITYSDSAVKDGVVAATASGRIWGTAVSKNADNPEKSTPLENSPLFSIKKFEISGIGKEVQNSTTPVEQNKPATNDTPANSAVEDSSSPAIPAIIITSTVVVIGGAIIVARFKKAKGADGREKTFEYNPETGEYENGDTILNTSNIDEVAKQAEKDAAWQAEEREKIKNRNTLEDRENKKMADRHTENIKEVERDIYIDRIASKNGITATDKKTIRKELSEKQKIKEEDAKSRQKIVEHIDTTINVTEKVVEAADYAMAAGEAVVPGGKAVSATYKVLKGVGEVSVDSTKNGGDIIEAVVTSSADAINTFTGSKLTKAGNTIGSQIAGKVSNAIYNDKSVSEAIEKGAKTGAAAATVNALGDELGGAFGTDAGNAVGNVAASAYQKHAVDPKMSKNLNKKKK